MKVVVEIENDAEIKKVERWLKLLDPSLFTIHRAEKTRDIAQFLDFVDTEAITVEKIHIPSREERNAR